MVARPRDFWPRPRYCEMVMACVELVKALSPSTRAVHCSWRVVPSAPGISSHSMGPMLGAAWARIPVRLLRYFSLSDSIGSVQAA